MSFLHNPKATHVVGRPWAGIGEEEDGTEGIIALPVIPAMGTRFEPQVRQLEQMTGKRARIVHFRRVGS